MLLPPPKCLNVSSMNSLFLSCSSNTSRGTSLLPVPCMHTVPANRAVLKVQLVCVEGPSLLPPSLFLLVPVSSPAMFSASSLLPLLLLLPLARS